MNNILTRKERLLLEELKTYGFPNRIYRYYINAVKNNRNTDYKTARKKIIRNIILGIRNENTWTKNKNCKVSYYGNLAIAYDINKKVIVWIKNYTKEEIQKKNKDFRFYSREKVIKKGYLNEVLKIGA